MDTRKAGIQDRVWRVLVVDDNPDFCNLIRIALEASGMSVCMAFTATDAVEEMKRCAVGMIVLDINLPGVGGVKFSQDIRRTDPYIPILFASGDAEQLKAIKVDDGLLKTDEDFRSKLIIKVREGMDKYILGYETRWSANQLRSLVPRVETLEAAHVVTGEVLKTHTDQLDYYNRATGKAALAKQILVALFGIASPLLVGFWYFAKDIVKEQIHEVVNIAPMRAELGRVVKAVDSIVADRELDRRERLQASAEQRTINAQQTALQSTMFRILDRLPERPSLVPGTGPKDSQR